MFDILKKLNQDKDRCVLIGRNALNLHMPDGSHTLFSTVDFDALCPDIKTTLECQELLLKLGCTKTGATFTSEFGELDVLVADIEYQEGVVCGYYNIPSLRPLWDARKKYENGILIPKEEALILDKLLNARENEGKDVETISIYLSLNPEKFESILEAINSSNKIDDRDKMLFSLYQAIHKNEKYRMLVESIMSRSLGTV
ncbi:MAG: hypothetical protein LBK56_14195 [Gracilibacteraceae bacterium]|jgi:hypothetical protein|nr:hypothetical protein [Gracilibacteraceae bacterium]